MTTSPQFRESPATANFQESGEGCPGIHPESDMKSPPSTSSERDLTRGTIAELVWASGLADLAGGFLARRRLTKGGELRRSFLNFLEAVVEPVENIARDRRNEKDVGVRNSPASRVKGDKLRLKSFAKTIGHFTGESENAPGLFGIQILPPGNVPFGEHERVSLGKRMDVQDGQRPIILGDSVGRGAARNDLAEDTCAL